MASGSSEGIEMDQNFAQRLLTEGATLVILNVPVGTDFGIDLKSWNTAENFKGIKMIPPGFHYVHYRPSINRASLVYEKYHWQYIGQSNKAKEWFIVNTDLALDVLDAVPCCSPVNEFGEMAPRIGFFYTFKSSEFIVRIWDSKEEDLSSESVPEETVQKLKDNLKELDRFLGPYPYDVWKQWNELISCITPPIVERCSPVCGRVRSALELEHCTDAARPRGGGESSKKKTRRRGLTMEEKEEELLPDMKPRPGTELRLSKLPDKSYPDGATPTEITKHSLDSSYALDTMLNKLPLPMEIIGEMQLAFVCFLVGQSLDAFEHWKKLVSLMCSADSAISQRRSIYIELMKALEVQLTHVPEDVLCDIVAGNNFVYYNLRKLFANIEMNSQVDGRLKSYASRFRERLSTKLLWDFSHLQDDSDDDAPVIVSLD